MAVEDSILDLTKKSLGLDAEYDVFDMDLVMFINDAFSTLHQIGLGKSDGFFIVDSTQTWAEFLGGRNDLNMAKTYVYMKVRMLFDPPPTSYLVTAYEKSIKEAEWRINVAVETIIASYGDIHIIKDNEDFPSSAPKGAIGYDPASGNVWRNS